MWNRRDHDSGIRGNGEMGHGGVVSQHEGRSCGAAPPHPDPPDLRRALRLGTRGRVPTRRARSILIWMVSAHRAAPRRDYADQRSTRNGISCQSVARVSGTGVARFSKFLGGGRSSDPSKPLCRRFEPGPRGRGRRFSWRASVSVNPLRRDPAGRWSPTRRTCTADSTMHRPRPARQREGPDARALRPGPRRRRAGGLSGRSP